MLLSHIILTPFIEGYLSTKFWHFFKLSPPIIMGGGGKGGAETIFPTRCVPANKNQTKLIKISEGR